MATVTAQKAKPTSAKVAKPKKGPVSNVYVYKGIDRKGNKIQGEMNGISSAIVKAQLLKQGISAKSVNKKATPLFGGGKKAIQPAEIAVF